MKAIPTWKQRKLTNLVSVIKSYPLSRSVETEKNTGVRYIHYGDIHTKRADKITSKSNIPNINVGDYKYLEKDDLALADASEDYQGIAMPSVIVEKTPFRIVAGLHTIALRPKTIEPLYLYYLIHSSTFRKYGYKVGTGMKVFGISKNNILKFETLFPCIEEQTKISSLLNKIDDTIALHQEKLSKLQSLKEAALQSLFPQKNETEPKVRFANFSSSWKQRKLGELVERVTRKNKNLDSTLPLTVSAQDGLVDQNEYFTKTVASRNVSNYYLLKKGEFAYNKSYSNGYPLGAIKRLDKYEKGVLSTLYVVFKPTYVNSDFLAKYYDSTHWYYEVYKHAAEGVRNHGLLNISPSDFFSTELKVPKSYEEQSKIGIFINKLDNSIALHQQRLEKLQNCKKVFLQKMFI